MLVIAPSSICVSSSIFWSFWHAESEAQESKSAEEYLFEEIEDQKKHLKEMSGVLDQQTKLLRLIVQVCVLVLMYQHVVMILSFDHYNS